MVEFTLWDIVRNLGLAARWTIALSVVAFVGGSVVGFALLFTRTGSGRITKILVGSYVQIFQGTPLLMQLFFVYFGFAALGLPSSAWTAAAICLTLYASAFLAEIWRGCVNAVPNGQWDAAKSIGLSFTQQLRLVILPQAVKIAVAPTVGFLVQVIKGTALASIIGFIELTKASQMIANATFKPFLIYSCVALFYFALCYPISYWSKRLEARLVISGR
jgi:polar amino acid transport system permease protein